MIHHLRRAAAPNGPDRTAIRAATLAADPTNATTLNDAALAELHQRRTNARKHTICGHLFAGDDAGLLIRTARNHGLTVGELLALDQGGQG